MNEKNYIERYWRDAKPEDAIKEPPMVARFRDSLDCNSCMSVWSEPQRLLGWDRSNDLNWSGGVCYWRFCQVYDAPDHGEGYELIDIRKVRKQEGDEVLGDDGKWSLADPYNFVPELHYRRRITPTVTYVPFTWEDREQLRGRIITYVGKSRTVEFRCECFAVDDDGLLVHDHYASWLCKNAVFVDTGKPVGKEVTQ